MLGATTPINGRAVATISPRLATTSIRQHTPLKCWLPSICWSFTEPLEVIRERLWSRDRRVLSLHSLHSLLDPSRFKIMGVKPVAVLRRSLTDMRGAAGRKGMENAKHFIYNRKKRVAHGAGLVTFGS